MFETVMGAAFRVSIIFSNLANKMIKTMKGEKVGRAPPITSIKRVRYDKLRKREQNQLGEERNNIPWEI